MKRVAVPRQLVPLRLLLQAHSRLLAVIAFALLLLLTSLLRSALQPAAAGALRGALLRQTACIPMDASHFDAAYFDPQACISPAERAQKLTGLVHALAHALSEQDIDYWLDSGTLLGQFREQGVLAWDNDVDFGITTDGYRYLRDNIIPLRAGVPPGRIELQVLDSDVNTGPERDRNIPVRLVETTRGFYIDVFVFAESAVNGIAMLSTPASSSWAKCAHCVHTSTYTKLMLVPKDYVYPLVPCLFAGVDVLCPAKRTLYLEHLYGTGFRVPDPAY